MSNYPSVKRATDRKSWCETCMRAVQPHVDKFPDGWTGLECPGSRMSDYLSMSTVLTMTGCTYEHLCHATSNDLGAYVCEQLGCAFSASEIAQWIRDGLPGDAK